MKTEAFESAVTDYTLAAVKAQDECALRLAGLSAEDWAWARATIQSWIDLGNGKAETWRDILAMAGHERAAQ